MPPMCSVRMTAPSRSRMVASSMCRSNGSRSPARASRFIHWAGPVHFISGSSRRIAVAAPALVIAHAGAAADLGQPEIEHAGLAKAQEISDGMDCERCRKRQERAGQEEKLRRNRGVDDEEIEGDSREHLRPCEGAEEGCSHLR